MPDDRPSVSGTLTRLSLDRRITVLVLFLTILVVGFIATLGIPVELVPRGFEGQSLQIYIPWRNAPAQEVLEKITLPLEEELSTVRGLEGLNSWSGTSGCRVFMRFKPGTDLAVAYREARDRVERARQLFPDDVDRVFIRKEDISGIPVAVIGLAIDPGLTDYYHLIDQEVVRPLSRIDGVANVTTDGLEEKEVIIEVDKQLAESHGLNIYQLGQDLAGDNFTMASGNVREAGKKFLLRSVATYSSLEELENRLLTTTVRLKDVARIKYEEPEKRFSVRVNGRPAIAAVIFKEGEANTVEVSRKINDAFEEMKDNPRLASIQMEPLFNQGTVVEDSLGNLVSGGRLGGIFAALVLFLFLRRFRLTLIITLSIPLSILIALVVIYFCGETLNLLTILGLVICVGLLVDNSVVVAENIHRLHRDGMPRREACIRGAGEIALAITLATLTTVIVFLPAALLEGEIQFFLLRLALPISVSLVASLFVALIFIPLSVYITLPARGQSGRDTWSRRAHERLNAVLRRFYDLTFGQLNRAYNHGLGFFLRRRLDLMLLLAGVFAATYFFAFKNIEFAPQQEEDQTGFNISVDMSREFAFEDVAEYFRAAEAVLEEKKKEFGMRGFFIFHRHDGGRIQGWFEEDIPRELTAKEVANKLLKELPQKPGVKLYYRQENQSQEAEGKDVFVVRLEGDDAVLLDELAEDLEPLFLRVDGVIAARMGNDPEPNELALVIDRERATASQINPQIIAGIVGYALRGQSLPKYNMDGREIPVRIRFREEDRSTLDDLADFKVPTPDGGVLPLSALTDRRMLQTAQGIFRQDKKVTRSLTLELEKEKADETRGRLMALQSRLDLPEGISFGAPSHFNPAEEMADMMIALPLSILFIYMLMGFLFESFILPLSIILTIPLASVGVAWIHYLTGRDLDVLGAVGSILLVGVVVNNGIVLIDYVNRLRLEGLTRTEALLTATERRFRPIVMTALTTIIGMIPLALSEPNRMGMSYKSFGLTLIGGMSAASILTLLVIPVFYTFFDDIRMAVARAVKRVLAGKTNFEHPTSNAQLRSGDHT